MIDGIIEWVNSLITIQPISSIGILRLISLYIQYTIVSIVCVLPFVLITHKNEYKLPSMRELFIVLPIEDLIFRWAPLRFISPQAGIYAHIMWAALHGFPSMIFAVLHGLLMLRLWLGGLWLEAISIHLLHDILCITIVRSVSNKE